MIDALKAEFRKLLSIRSTYIVSGLSLLLTSGISFYFLGVKAVGTFSPFSVQPAVLSMLSGVGIFVGIVAILLVCHEYRYNTISYTLTMTNRRIKVLAAKVFVIAIYAVVMALLTILLTSILVPLGVRVGGGAVMAQNFDMWGVLWRALAYMTSVALMGALFGFLFRSLVFTIVVYFVLPTTIEPVLINFLRANGNYLPSTAQNQIIAATPGADAFSPLASAGVVALYLAVGWIIATILFIRRDAN